MRKNERGYDPNKKNYRIYGKSCVYRYDDVRPNRGTSRKDHTGNENPEKSNSGGHKALTDRCQLINTGNRKCLFPNETHLTCPISTHKKPQTQKKKKRKRSKKRH